jgi:xanthine/uracil/vitamin C permease (AzgA family)
MSRPAKLDRWFKLSERNTNLRTELITYAVFVNLPLLVNQGFCKKRRDGSIG